MNEELINIEQKAKDCSVHPYFMMDILSGECLGVYTCANVETAIRSFCMSMDQMPQGIVHDAVLVCYDSREILFEGKNYLETWQQHQRPVMPMPHFSGDKMKGVNNEG